jgi:2-oxoisovalerate dehydrogenase E2 component (dihydrolipoyl transacylase)
MKIFKLPDLGEGLPDATILKWYVKEGEEVTLDQLLLTVESAKASVDIPASFKGKVSKLFGEEGEVIKTGEALIGYEGENLLQLIEDQGIVGKIVKEDLLFQTPNAVDHKNSTKKKFSLEAKAFARKLNLDLEAVQLEKEWITLEDLQQEVNAASITHFPLSGKRLAMAQRMIVSQKEVVPVTCSCEVKLQLWDKSQDITSRAIRAIGKACIEVPIINAYFEYSTLTYELNQQVNVGIAFDAEDGTYLPVIKNIIDLSLEEIRKQINSFKMKVKNKALLPKECSNPTILLSNFGPLGVSYANPIVIPPMVGIVGIGKLQEQVEIANGHLSAVRIMPLILTTNHILITGGEASKFLFHMARDLEKGN